MSYDLGFWSYEDDTIQRSPDDHRDTYLALCEGTVPAGLKLLPTDQISKRVAAFLDQAWTPDGGSAWTRPGAVIELSVNPSWVRVDLRGKWKGDDANAIIEIMGGEFGCPLYDPQIGKKGERFAK